MDLRLNKLDDPIFFKSSEIGKELLNKYNSDFISIHFLKLGPLLGDVNVLPISKKFCKSRFTNQQNRTGDTLR